MSTTELAPTAEPTDAPPSPTPLPRARRAARTPGWQRGRADRKTTPPAAAPAARTTRVLLRKLDAWTVLKLSLVYYLALFVVFLVAGTMLWVGATAVGVVGNIEHFMVDIGFENFRFLPSKLLGGVALGGLVLVVAGTCANVLLTALFNLMSDVVGGLKLTLQEDPERPVAPTTKDGSATV